MRENVLRFENDLVWFDFINGSSSEYGFEHLEAFEKYLKNRNLQQEEMYGIFDNDISVCKFFNSKDNSSLLADIKRKNEEEGMGNINIPNSNITLINYSICPKCNTIFSFKDISSYFLNPVPDIKFKSRAFQYRNDTKVHCHICFTYFIPSLVIVDGTPYNEVQFLCRAQTVEAVEKYLLSINMKVLTKEKSNIITKGNYRAIRNDVPIIALKEKPTLISNFIQYTPFNQILNFVYGENIDNNDLLFNKWIKATN